MFWLSLKASLHIFHFENKKNTTKDGRTITYLKGVNLFNDFLSRNHNINFIQLQINNVKYYIC